MAGLDASTKRIGYCAPDGSMHSVTADRLPAHPSPWDLALRCLQLRSRLARIVSLNPPRPTLVVYEAAFAQR
ncbi:MAG TPA: hypothetical protein PLV68_06885 [Ilumatobacteraceae bacterium]|nr:hypothetical protein [Ilumatobacteraceae bacterium]